MKINPQILGDLKNYKDNYEAYLAAIDVRVNEIYDKIFELFKVAKKLNYSAYIKYNIIENDYVDECEYCQQPLDYYKINELDAFVGSIITINTNYYGSLNIIDVDGKILNLAKNFPQRWLYDDNFEEELKSGYERLQKLYEEKKAKYKAKKSASKEEKLKLQELIKSKLSAEELELISFKKK